MQKADIKNDAVQGIPMNDALMATYAAYYVGANQHDPSAQTISAANTDIDGRATNTFGMEQHLADFFAKPDSPFLVIDDSNRWNERNDRTTLDQQRAQMGGGYFVTLYHKASGKLMVVSPGLEGDTPGSGTNNITHNFLGLASRGAGDYADVLFNAEDALKGSAFLRMTRTMQQYLGDLDKDLKEQRISIQTAQTPQALCYAAGETIKDKVVLAGHSAGTLPALALTGLGFKSFMVEPRAYDTNLENRLLKNLTLIGTQIDRDDFRANLQQGQTSIRASWQNIWNSGMSLDGGFHSETFGKNYVAHRFGTEKDNMIAGTHREEVMTPGLLGLADAKGFKGMIGLIADAVPGAAARQFGESIAPTATNTIKPKSHIGKSA